jgi:hypothetical protein
MLSIEEQKLIAVVRNSDAPFLGLLGDALSPEMRGEIANAIAVDRTVEGYVRLLYRYPALFATHLTSTLMAGMGQTGNFDPYRHIYAALQLSSELTTDEKETLWTAFRRAVLRMGLEVSSRTSGQGYMVATYLRQVGVPLAFADDLAEKMLAFAKTAGLPDEDDPEGIVRWQSALESKLSPPFSSVAQKAVAFDTQGFYARTFIKVYASENRTAKANPLEQAMARAFEKLAGGSHFRRASLPYLALSDGNLGIFVPAGEMARTIGVTVDGVPRLLRVGSDDEFLSIPKTLPFIVSVQDEASQQTFQYEVWGDEKPNRILLFSESGRFKGRAQLGMSESLILPPGRYAVLSRFRPAGVEVDELSSEPRLYQFGVLLHPGQEQKFSNGPAELTLQGEGCPLARWTGSSRGTKDGVEFNYGVLGLELEFPADWLTTNQQFQLVLSSNAYDAQTIVSIIADENGHATVSALDAAWFENHPPGLSRILAEIKRPGEVRPLLRTSVLFWSGLESVSSGLNFRLKGNPKNLVESDCKNFELLSGLIKPKDNSSRHLSLSFQLDDRRVQTLTWNAPGIFLEVTGINQAGARFRINRPLGSTEVVSMTSSKQVIVSSSESGELSLGEWVQYHDFSKQTSKHLPATFLASRITAQSHILSFRPSGTTIAMPLLKLVQPHYLHGISDKVSDGQLIINLESPNEIEAVLVKAHEVLSGQDIEVELLADESDWTTSRLGRARLMTRPKADGGFTASVYISLELMAAGAWTFKFDGRISSIWGHLQNQRNDQFAAGLICDNSGAQAGTASMTAGLADLTEKRSLSVFMRVQQELLPCYAQASWASMKWLSTAWRVLAEKWRGHEADGITVFIDMACSRPAEDTNPSWMPQQHIGADLPGIFALPAAEYRKVNENRHPLARSLRTIAQVDRQYPVIFDDLLHLSAAMGFSNFPVFTRGGAPREFSLERYGQALKQTDSAAADLTRLEDPGFMPEAGDHLGPIHYRYAMSGLETGYENSLGGNEIRRGQAIGLCRHLRQVMPTLDGSMFERLKGTRPHVDPWPQPDDDLVPELAQRQENLSNILHFLSLFAFSCRSGVESPKVLQTFMLKLKTTDLPVEACITYLLQIGDAFFAYYLLLWEVAMTSEHIS